MVRHATILLAFAAAWLLSATAAAGEATVRADRTTVFENESFNVEFVYSEEVGIGPDFSVLEKDFDIIAQNRRSNLQSINGRFSYELSWQLTLMPKRAGVLVIPPVRFDNDESPAVEITVKPAPDADANAPLGDLSLEVEMTPEEGYVQGQFIYTQRLYHRGWLAGGDLSDPEFEGGDAVVRQLEQVKRYSLFRGGERYQVYEQSYLVFPQRSGTLSTGEASFTGQLRPPGRAPLLKRVSAPSVSVRVKPVPAGFDGNTFLPAASLTLEEEWPEAATFEQGRPVTRVLRLTAAGLTAAQLPEFRIAEVDGLRVYADQARREDSYAQDGVTGTVEQSVALVPQRPGTVRLPAIEVVWWDTGEDRRRRATLPARDIVVAAAANAAGGPVAPALSGEAVAGAPSGGYSPDLWRPLTWTFAALWALTLLAWWRSARRARPPRRPDARRNAGISLFRARTAVKRACNEADPHAAAAALREWARAVWPEDPPRSLRAMAARAGGELAIELERLAAVCYGADGTWDDPHRLWRVLGQARQTGAERDRPADDQLAPL